MKKDELIPRFGELTKMKSLYINNKYFEEYFEVTQRLIDMYRKCIDLSDITEEELEDQDGYQ
jgi:hypothetical protein